MIDFNSSPTELVEALNKVKPDYKAIEESIKQYNPETHKIIVDTTKYPNKIVESSEGTSSIPINRVAISMQKYIVGKSVSFAFAKAPTLLFNDEEKAEPVKDIFKKNKIASLTQTIATQFEGTGIAAEIWYHSKVENPQPGESPFRLRVLPLKPLSGDVFYPIWENGDMVAFVRELKKKSEDGQKDIEYREIYTAEKKITLKNDNGWQEESNEINVIGKIPVIYIQKDKNAWFDVQTMIERMEEIVSGHAEVNDYHFAPKMKVSGEIIDFAKKGEKGAIIEIGKDANLEYLTWNQGTESLKLEFENLRTSILSLTQTPDISFENMKAMGQISGVAAQFFFMDAHLKVEMNKEIWEDYISRRVSIVKEYVAKLLDTSKEAAMGELTVDIQLNPYIINDISSKIEYLMRANGNKPVISQKTAIKLLGIADDVEEELAQIEAETKEIKPNEEKTLNI